MRLPLSSLGMTPVQLAAILSTLAVKREKLRQEFLRTLRREVLTELTKLDELRHHLAELTRLTIP